jgi:streptogramin lyase
MTPSTAPFAGNAIQGKVYGGQQPINGASVVLYAAGAGGNGLAAQNLTYPNVISTKADGSFSISGDYQCPASNPEVYVVAQGGNPGYPSRANNAAIDLVAAIGDCSNLASTPHIIVNEATTVAAAWALAPFIGSSNNIGSSGTNTTGLRNAFSVANSLVNIATGAAPGSAVPAGAITETAKLYSLANVLAACVNSDGGSGCQPLFTVATAGGVAPSDTFDAAVNIVRNPSTNVGKVFSAVSAQPPFQPARTTAPNDWTMSITYGNCTSGCGGLNGPGDVAIDTTGNVWVANYSGGVVSKFSPTGVPAAMQGFPGTGLEQSYGITVDAQNNAWVSNYQSVTAANNSHSGSVSKFSSSGTELSGVGYTVGGVYYPLAIAADSNGSIWVADYGASAASLLASDGSAISGPSGYGPSQIPFTTAVALDGSHNAWFVAQGPAVRVTPAGVVSSFPCCDDPQGIAVDQSGNIWVADYGGYSVVELNSSGTVTNRISTMNGPTAPQGIAVDGAGNIWTSNYFGNSINKIVGASATMASPAAGYGMDAPLDEPYGIAIDASGNLWLANSGGHTLTQFLGLATPIRTPLLGPPAQP